MSGADLNLDLNRLEQLDTDLNAVISEFKNADDFSDAVADATGHDGLHDHVRDFAHKWNEKRKSMTTNVENLQKQVHAISNGFKQVDDGLAKALREASSEGAKSYPSPKNAK